jgi:hypothetical protein
MHTATTMENVYVTYTGVELTALDTQDHVIVAVMEHVPDQTTTIVLNVQKTLIMTVDSVNVTTSGAMIAVPNIPDHVTVSVTHVGDQMKSIVILVHLIHLTSPQLDIVLVTVTGVESAVESSLDNVLQLVVTMEHLPHPALIFMPKIALTVSSTHTVLLMDLVFASKTGATRTTALFTTESVTVNVEQRTDVSDQMPTNVRDVVSTQKILETVVNVKTDGPETAVKYGRVLVTTTVLHAQVIQSSIALTALKMLTMMSQLENVSVILAGADQDVPLLTQPAVVVNVETHHASALVTLDVTTVQPMHTVTIVVYVNAMMTGEEMMIAASNIAVNVLADVKPVVDQTPTNVPHVQITPPGKQYTPTVVLAMKAGPDVAVINGQEPVTNSVLDASAQQSGIVLSAHQTPLCQRAMDDVSVYQDGQVTAVSIRYTTVIHHVLVTNAVSRTDKLVLMSVPAVMTDITLVISQADTVTHVTTTA